MASPTQWLPYCGPGPEPAEWFMRWNFDIVLLAIVFGVFALGMHLAPERRNKHAALLLVVLVLFVSPLCALGSSLFTIRVVHHVALALLVAPLLVDSLSLHMRRIRFSLVQLTAFQAVIFWAWHSPALYSAALSNDAVFWAMQLTITVSAAIWWARLRQSQPMAAVGSLLATMVQMGALGALLVFVDRALYAPHWLTTQAWGLSPLEDQQTGGLIMWAPASAIYLLAAVILLYRSLQPAVAR